MVAALLLNDATEPTPAQNVFIAANQFAADPFVAAIPAAIAAAMAVAGVDLVGGNY